MSTKRITIAGGGLSGALMAKYLGLAGHQVTVFERRGDIRDATIVRGRSINLAVSERGLTALNEVDLKEKVLSHAVPMRGRIMHSVSGDLTFQPYSKNPDECIQSISRGGLNQLLLEEADQHDNVTLHFEKRCIDVDPDTGTAFFIDERSGEVIEQEADLVIGADGAFSAVRGRLQRSDRFDYSQSYLDAGYLELHIPAAEDGGFRMEKNALHIWPRGKFMMIALPNEDGTFTVTCFWPLEGPHSFGRITKEAEVQTYFQEWFPDAVPLMPSLMKDYTAGTPSSLVTVRCAPWSVGKVCLVGDAAHAIVPFYGQGMNAGFEDCRILNGLLNANPNNWGKALEEYAKERKPNGDAIADLAIANFYEMRDHVGRPSFLLRKKLEKFLHKNFSGFYLPLYSMVSFSNVPYAEAVERAKRQDRIVMNTAVGALLLLLLIVLGVITWM